MTDEPDLAAGGTWSPEELEQTLDKATRPGCAGAATSKEATIRMKNALVLVCLALALAGSVARASDGTEYVSWLDVNDDGLINIIDIMLVASHWGASEDQPVLPDVSVMSSTSWWTADGEYLYVTGEVVNNAGSPVHNVRIDARFYSEDTLVTKADGGTPLAVIPSGEPTCFEVRLGGWGSPIPPTLWDRYELEVYSEFGGGRLPELAIDPVNVTYTGDSYRFQGVVTNLEADAVGSPWVIMTVFDENNDVIACDSSWSVADVLGPGETAFAEGSAPGRVANEWSVRWQFSGSVAN